MKLLSITIAFLALCLSSRAEETVATKLLKERSKDLLPTVTRVSKSVYCASGYSPANISMIVGTNGIVIVDTGMFPDDARAVMKEFRKVTQLPVTGVILTHGHGDHTGGLGAFMEAGPNGAKPAVYGRSPFNTEGGAFQSSGLTINRVRGARQGGFLLTPENRINNGITPAVYPPKDRNIFDGGTAQPTDTFGDERKKIVEAGLELDLVAAPGETSDELYVWFREESRFYRRQLLSVLAEPLCHPGRRLSRCARLDSQPRHDARQKAGACRPWTHPPLSWRGGDDGGAG